MKPLKILAFAGGLLGISAGILALQALVYRLIPPRLTETEMKGAAIMTLIMCNQVGDGKQAMADLAATEGGDQVKMARFARELARQRGCID